uniref:Ig-like domain-containing protein n=1 Tax=Biomphalaria glabrata TaxID=6526 RepID=A0A2C9KPK5_BIOGL
NIPNGRPWEIHFVSGDTDNYRDYSIIIYLEHVTLFDAGRYRCTYLGNGDDRLVNSDPFTVLMKPTPESKIVNKESVGQNETFTVTCDIKKFRETDSPDNNSISTMAAERKLTGEDNYIFMARFTPFAAAEENKRMKNEPAGRQWDVTFSGSETEYNGDTIKIVIDVVDGSSADVGLYRCSYTDAEAALHYSDSVYLRSN